MYEAVRVSCISRSQLVYFPGRNQCHEPLNVPLSMRFRCLQILRGRSRDKQVKNWFERVCQLMFIYFILTCQKVTSFSRVFLVWMGIESEKKDEKSHVLRVLQQVEVARAENNFIPRAFPTFKGKAPKTRLRQRIAPHNPSQDSREQLPPLPHHQLCFIIP